MWGQGISRTGWWLPRGRARVGRRSWTALDTPVHTPCLRSGLTWDSCPESGWRGGLLEKGRQELGEEGWMGGLCWLALVFRPSARSCAPGRP